jgi:hypothetical protein
MNIFIILKWIMSNYLRGSKMSYFDSPPPTKKNERKLTQTQKLKIKNIAGRCEHCHKDPHEVHHINGDKSDDSYSNLIVLCGGCHKDAEGKSITGKFISKQELHEELRNRDPNKATRIREILKKKPTPRKSKQNDFPTGLGGSFRF